MRFGFALDDDGFAGSGGVWRDDVEVDAVMLDGWGWCAVLRAGVALGVRGEEFFAFELELLAFEVEVGEFLDVAEQLFEQGRSGLGAHEFEGGLAEKLVHG